MCTQRGLSLARSLLGGRLELVLTKISVNNAEILLSVSFLLNVNVHVDGSLRER